MATKKTLEAQLEALKEVPKVMISKNVITTSENDAKMEAIKELAIAIQLCAKALTSAPAIQIIGVD